MGQDLMRTACNGDKVLQLQRWLTALEFILRLMITSTRTSHCEFAEVIIGSC